MFSSGSQGIFENPAALAALAALVPEPAPAEASGSDHARKAGGRTTKASHGKVVEQKRIGGEFTPTADPAWIKTRLGVLERIAARNAAEMATLDKPAITVTLPNGKTIDGTAWTTTPFEVAASISKGLANDVVIANVRYSKRVAGATAAIAAVDAMEDSPAGSVPCVGGESPVAEWELWDVTRALEGDCELQLIKFDDPRGKEVFWHSSAHVLGEALESLFGAKLTHGPPTEGGFFYDSFLGGNTVTGEMIAALEKKVKQIADEKQPFERVVVTKDECLELFSSNPFKVLRSRSRSTDARTPEPLPSKTRPVRCSLLGATQPQHRSADTRTTPQQDAPRPLLAAHASPPFAAGRDDLVEASRRRLDDGLPQRPVRRPVQGAAPAVHRQGQGLRHHQEQRRAVARPAGQRRKVKMAA